jgi:hypothetical protein
MATSGVYTWAPTVGRLIEEASERAGIKPSSLTGEHLMSARESLNYLFRDIEAEDIEEFYRIDQESTSVAAATTNVALASGSIEVMQVWYREQGGSIDMPLTRLSREDYNAIPDKTVTNDPTSFYVDHSALNAPVMRFWPIPDAQITLYYDRLRFIDDAVSLSNTADAHRLLYDAIAYGLAMRIAEKWNVEKFALMERRFAQTFSKAKSAIIPHGDVMIYAARTRRRRA